MDIKKNQGKKQVAYWYFCVHFKVNTEARPWQRYGVIIKTQAGTKWQDKKIIPVEQHDKGYDNLDIYT